MSKCMLGMYCMLATWKGRSKLVILSSATLMKYAPCIRILCYFICVLCYYDFILLREFCLSSGTMFYFFNFSVLLEIYFN